VIHQHDAPPLGGQRKQGGGFAGGHRQGFFDQDVFAGEERFARQRGVGAGGRGDGDRVDFGVAPEIGGLGGRAQGRPDGVDFSPAVGPAVAGCFHGGAVAGEQITDQFRAPTPTADHPKNDHEYFRRLVGWRRGVRYHGLGAFYH